MTSSRISLLDCTLDLRLPILSHTTSSQTADNIALHAAATPTLDHTHVYTGSTLFLLLTLTAPPAPSVTIPIVTQSSWTLSARRPLQFVKSVWVFIKPSVLTHSKTLSYAISATLRERVATAGNNSTVWATIDRASRLFGRSVALRAKKSLMLNSPVDTHCRVIPTADEHPLVALSVRNVSTDCTLHLYTPTLNLATSRPATGSVKGRKDPRLEALTAAYEAVWLSPLRELSPATDADAVILTLYPTDVFNFTLRLQRRQFEALPKLHPGNTFTSEHVHTEISISWFCTRDKHVPIPSHTRPDDVATPARRRYDVATHTSTFMWSPLALSCHATGTSLPNASDTPTSPTCAKPCANTVSPPRMTNGSCTPGRRTCS